MIGKTIGDYLILEKRGEGGMGMFFKARDVRLDRLVGLKTIRAELLHEPEILAKLEEEAKSLARLDHPSIARLLHYMVIEDQRYIVMEYVEGSDLAEKLRREGPLSLDLLRHIVPQICAAIGYAHNKHVIHRDIKPSNILLTDENTVKVTDFGIAKILGVSAKTKTGVATGSLPYMAPEQIRGTGVDARTDIYQLGVLLFELLTGQRPFQAETEYDMMSHHLSTPPPGPSSINQNVSRALDEVVLKALAKNPDERFGSAGELASAFRNAAAGQDDSRTVYGVDQRPQQPPARRPNANRNRKRLLGGIAIGVLAALAFAKVFLLSGKNGPSSLGPLVEVVVQATIPPQTPSHWKVIERFTVSYPSNGSGRAIFVGDQRDLSPAAYDTMSTAVTHPLEPGDKFSMFLWMAPGDSVRFLLEVSDPSGELICKGERIESIKGPRPVSVDIPVSLAVKTANQTPNVEKPPDREVTERPTVVRQPDSVPAGGRYKSSSGNLTIDVQPFTERERIESIWIDGKKQSGPMPLSLNVQPGLRVIRWQIGQDIWTDTVTGGNEHLQKNLMFEMSRGRINVTATFPGGTGYADVVLDGRPTGVGTPGELREVPAGPHEVVLKIDGYRMRGGPYIVRVPANERARINIEMVRE